MSDKEETQKEKEILYKALPHSIVGPYVTKQMTDAIVDYIREHGTEKDQEWLKAKGYTPKLAEEKQNE